MRVIGGEEVGEQEEHAPVEVVAVGLVDLTGFVAVQVGEVPAHVLLGWGGRGSRAAAWPRRG